MSSPAFNVGSLPVFGRRILAPMDGFSDLPFRSLCREFGSAMSYTSFVSAAAILAGSPQADAALQFLPEERPVIFQIFDDDELRLEQAARQLLARRPDIVDVNMGCSARCVAGRGAGAGLLRQPVKVGRIVRRLSRALDLPVTAKIRLGWDEASRNYLDVARAIEDNGGRLIAVHGRTKVQAYGGSADWAAIAEIKAAVRIPVLGNGDIRSAEDASTLMSETGCDGVMIGRGAIGNPWIFREGPTRFVPPPEVLAVVRRHLARMLAQYGDVRGVQLFRKHLARYLDHLTLADEIRRHLLTASTEAELLGWLASSSSELAHLPSAASPIGPTSSPPGP